ncbi:MAG: DMT family transporter [Spirochaetota bacterium]
MGAEASIGHRGRGIAFALLSALGFSTLGIFAKLIYAEGFSIPAALAWRFTIAGLVLWIVVIVTKRPMPRPLLPVLLMAFLGFAPQAGLYFLTVSILDPGIASLLLYLYPSFVVLIGLALFRKRPGWIRSAALLLSLSGCLVTFWKAGSYPPLGIALGLTVALSYAVYLVIGERVFADVDPIVSTALVMGAAAFVYWIITFVTGGLKVPATLPSVGVFIAVALFSSVLPITMLFASIQLIGAADTSLVSTMEPVLTVTLSALLLGEHFGPAQILGGILIITSVLMIDLAPRIMGLFRAGRA